MMLRRLRRLGCPWDPSGDTFTEAVMPTCGRGVGVRKHVWGYSLPVLQWLVAEGCPVEWRAAKERAEERLGAGVAEVKSWIEAQESRD